jgi:hypothetical protein
MTELSRLTRFVLWDFERGSWPYDLVCLLLLMLLLFIQPEWLGDPTAAPMRKGLP